MALSKVSKRGGDKAAESPRGDAEEGEAAPERAAVAAPAPGPIPDDPLARPAKTGDKPMTTARVIRTEEDEEVRRQKLSQVPVEEREYLVDAVTYYDGGQKPALPGEVLKGLPAAVAKQLLEQGAIKEIIPR